MECACYVEKLNKLRSTCIVVFFSRLVCAKKNIVASYWLEVLYSSSDREIPHYSLRILREAGVSCNYCLQLPCITESEGKAAFLSAHGAPRPQNILKRYKDYREFYRMLKKGRLMGKFPVSGPQTWTGYFHWRCKGGPSQLCCGWCEKEVAKSSRHAMQGACANSVTDKKQKKTKTKIKKINKK